MPTPKKKAKTVATGKRCRSCGKPEERTYWGYTNLTPYSQICVECVNAIIKQSAKENEPVSWEGEN